ncbi:MAG: hypothetical protein AAGA10_11580 [Bacteroidota bacterium]
MNILNEIISEKFLYALGFGVAILLIGIFSNRSATFNSRHDLAIRSDSLHYQLNPRQYGEIRYEKFLEMIYGIQAKNQAIEVDTSAHLGHIRIYFKGSGNYSKSSFNRFVFNKMSSDDYPDVGDFGPFLKDSLDITLGYEPGVYGLELEIKKAQGERYLQIPYQMLIRFLTQQNQVLVKK